MAIGPTTAMTIRLPAEMAEQLKLVADCDGEPIIDTIRAAIGTWIEQRKADPHFQDALRRHIERAQRMAVSEVTG